jgi:hypothetical protein
VKYNKCFVVYLILNSVLKKVLKSVSIWISYGQKYRGPFFDSQCIMLLSAHEYFLGN